MLVGFYFGLGLLSVSAIFQDFLIILTFPLARIRDSLALKRLSLFFLRRFFYWYLQTHSSWKGMIFSADSFNIWRWPRIWAVVLREWLLFCFWRVLMFG